MPDLSNLTDEELKQLYSSQSQQSSATTDLSKVSDEDLKKMYSSSAPVAEEAPSKSIIDTVTDPIIAAGSGVAEGAGSIANSLGGLVKELIGHVSPTAKKYLDKGDAALAKHIAETEASNQIPNAQAEYPRLTDAGKGVGMAGGVLAAGGAIPGGVVAQATGQGILGSAMAGEGNRGAGFVGGAALPVIASTVAAPLGKYLSANATLPGKITELRSSINAAKEYPGKNIHEATDLSFAKFKDTPGEISAVRPKNALNSFIDTHGNRLSKQQLQIVEETQKELNNAKTLEDLHNVRKSLTADLDKIFLKGNDAVVGATRADLMNIKNSLESNLQMNARKLGTIDQYKEANSLYKQSREADQINKAFDQTIQSSGGNDWTAFNTTFKKLRTGDDVKVGSGQNRAVKQAEKDLSPQTKQQIQGIQNVIKEASSLYGVHHTNIRIGGVGIGDVILGTLKNLANVPGGKYLLIKAGSPGGRELSKKLLQGLVNIGQSEYIKTANPPESNQ